jgi:predicted O-linked N-acetylglucosamine transferase (SPINDLY family)
MGLPVLTRSGRSFASRMAGALLTAAGMEELVTHNPSDYENTAVLLASNPMQCQRIREHLAEVREKGVLFATPLFVTNLELQFNKLIEEL